MTVHDDDAVTDEMVEAARAQLSRTTGRRLTNATIKRVYAAMRAKDRLSPSTAEGVLREALVEVSTALQLLIERQGEHIFELPGATGVSDLDRADRALGKARTALSRNVRDAP